jgi:prepilin-type N-terminal cleavage/methylation domain-containing protein
MKISPPSRTRRGFTLLEVVIAVGLLSIIVGMVVGIARTSLALGKTIVETQNEEMRQQAFFELLGRRFASLPGNARLDLKVDDKGSHYLSDLTLQNVPLGFNWSGGERIAKAVQLSTVKRRSGFLDIVLRYYENEILEDSEQSTMSALKEKPFAEIVLLQDVSYFEWRVLDGRSMEWQFDWHNQGRLPLQIEVTMAMGAKGEEIRQIFWIPPRLNPEVVMRQMTQGANQNQNPNIETPEGQPEDGQDGGGSVGLPEININPGGETPPNNQ